MTYKREMKPLRETYFEQQSRQPTLFQLSFKIIVFTGEWVVKNCITHNALEEIPPIRKSKQKRAKIAA